MSPRPSARTSPIKRGVSESTRNYRRLLRQPLHTGGAAVLNVTFAHPHALCTELLRRGGSVKTSPWLGSKHPAGFSPMPQELWVLQQKHNRQLQAARTSKLDSLSAESLPNPGVRCGQSLVNRQTPLPAWEPALQPGDGDRGIHSAVQAGKGLQSVLFRDAAHP